MCFSVYQLYSMLNPKHQSAYIHHHFHHHYHHKPIYTQDKQLPQRYYSPPLHTPQKTPQNNSGILPTKSNSKNQINPELSQLYQQINQKPFIIPNQTPKSPRITSNSPNLYQSKKQKDKQRQSNSKQQLLKQIERYQQYLRKTSRPNLFVPKSENIKKLFIKQVKSSETLTSLNQLVQINENPQNKRGGKQTDDDMVMTRAGSKLFSTMQEINLDELENDDNQVSTKNYHQPRAKNVSSQSQLNIRQSQRREQNQRKSSEVNNNRAKGVDTDSGKKGRISSKRQIVHLNAKQDVKYQGKSFSLFKRCIQQEKSQQQQKMKKSQLHKSKQDEQNYGYQLIRQECQYLRNKFIQQIQQKDKIKF